MKYIYFIICLGAISSSLFAQKIDYKDNIISVDKIPIAKIEVEKENFGLTKNFNLYSLNGEKLVIAVFSTEYEGDKSDNTNAYYNVTFLPTNQSAIVKLSILGTEKGFAKLIGQSKIVEENTLNPDKVNQLIASKGVSPKVQINYTLVNRSKNWPIHLTPEQKIEQANTEIGFFIPKTQTKTKSYYEFFLPNGILVAKVNFSGGNNAQNFVLFTPKDDQNRVVSIPQKEVVKGSASDVDVNFLTLKRVTQWLVEHNYL